MTVKTLLCCLFTVLCCLLQPSAAAPLPDSLLAAAVMEEIEYDSEFDYRRLGRISRLNIYPEGWRAPRNLVDHVIVNKSHHQMFLMRGDEVVRSYWIALSDRPQGHKQYEGDRRTPEGTYILDYVKPRSYYYKAFHISYPNAADIAAARRYGRRPGGMIMVHGQPPSRGDYHENVQRSDWTNGCIAILNPEMDEFISLVDPGTPITINP